MTEAEPRVAVVGAGLAGLTAALELRERGIAVTVLERATRPGGRARRAVRDGLPLEVLSPVVSSAAAAASSSTPKPSSSAMDPRAASGAPGGEV